MEDGWSEALALLQRALAILDETKAPSEIGAYLDLAIVRLSEYVEAAAARGRSGIASIFPDQFET